MEVGGAIEAGETTRRYAPLLNAGRLVRRAVHVPPSLSLAVAPSLARLTSDKRP